MSSPPPLLLPDEVCKELLAVLLSDIAAHVSEEDQSVRFSPTFFLLDVVHIFPDIASKAARPQMQKHSTFFKGVCFVKKKEGLLGPLLHKSVKMYKKIKGNPGWTPWYRWGPYRDYDNLVQNENSSQRVWPYLR